MVRHGSGPADPTRSDPIRPDLGRNRDLCPMDHALKAGALTGCRRALPLLVRCDSRRSGAPRAPASTSAHTRIGAADTPRLRQPADLKLRNRQILAARCGGV